MEIIEAVKKLKSYQENISMWQQELTDTRFTKIFDLSNFNVAYLYGKALQDVVSFVEYGTCKEISSRLLYIVKKNHAFRMWVEQKDVANKILELNNKPVRKGKPLHLFIRLCKEDPIDVLVILRIMTYNIQYKIFSYEKYRRKVTKLKRELEQVLREELNTFNHKEIYKKLLYGCYDEQLVQKLEHELKSKCIA